MNESIGQSTKHGSETSLHMGIATRGKLYALEGNHARALQYYRIAIRLAVEAKEPEIFFRHYLDCVMESLEITGAYDEVLAYCDKAVELYADSPPPNQLATMDLASIHLRRGCVLLRRKEAQAARAAMKLAVETARSAGGRLGLAETISRWLDAGYTVDQARLLAEQRRGGYFSVQRDKVDPSRAIELSEEELMAVGRF